MPHPEAELPPLAQLEQAVHTIPPTEASVAAARAAIGALAQQIPTMERGESVGILQDAATLCGELAVAGVDEAVASEFGAHRDTYAAVAGMLGGTNEPQAERTDTAAKSAGSMTGGKS